MTVTLCCLIDRAKRHACNLGEFTNHFVQYKIGKLHSLHSANAKKVQLKLFKEIDAARNAKTRLKAMLTDS